MRTNHVVDACCVHLNVLQLPACFFTCPIGIAGMVEMMNTMSMCVRPATTSKRTPEVTKRRKSHRTGNVLIHCHVSHLNQPGTSWTCQENGPPSLPEVDLARLEGNQVREKAALSAAVAATSEASYVCIFYQQIFQQFFGDDVYSIFSPTQPLFFLYMLISASDLWMFVSGQQVQRCLLQTRGECPFEECQDSIPCGRFAAQLSHGPHCPEVSQLQTCSGDIV